MAEDHLDPEQDTGDIGEAVVPGKARLRVDLEEEPLLPEALPVSKGNELLIQLIGRAGLKAADP